MMIFILGRLNDGKEWPIIELGGQWIHGQRGNSVFEVCLAEMNNPNSEVKDLVDLNAPNYMEQFYHWHQLNEKENGM